MDDTGNDANGFRRHSIDLHDVDRGGRCAAATVAAPAFPELQNFAIAMARNVRGWPGEMLLSPSADAQ